MAKLILEYPLSNDSVFDSAIYSWRLESYVYIRIFKLQILSLLLFFITRLSMYLNKPFWIKLYQKVKILAYASDLQSYRQW